MKTQTLPLSKCPYCDHDGHLVSVSSVAVPDYFHQSKRDRDLCDDPNQSLLIFNAPSAGNKPCQHLLGVHGECALGKSKSDRWTDSFDFCWWHPQMESPTTYFVFHQLLHDSVPGHLKGDIPVQEDDFWRCWSADGDGHRGKHWRVDGYAFFCPLKPEAPIDYRGECRPIKTVVPGMELCEHLPLHAKVADRFNLIRSISHGFANHAAGAGRFLSGYKPFRLLDPLAQYPCLGPVVSKMLDGRRDPALPRYVGSAANVYGGGAASLGDAYLPFVVSGDPNAETFKVDNLSLSSNLKDRLDDRRAVLGAIDRLRNELNDSGAMETIDKYNQEAVNLLTSERARVAFDISKEDAKTREKYGRHKWGQRALLARRLVEAGVSFVTMQMQNPNIPKAIGNWDIHAVNGHLFDDTAARLPVYDRAISALVEDIYDRGLDKQVMLIVSGEFGRTPRINPQKGTASKVVQPGRDHYPGAMSVLVAGGGMRTGQVIGSTTSKGERPKDRKLDPNDLLATIYRHLGIDYREMVPDNSGRPVPLIPHGEQIRELL